MYPFLFTALAFACAGSVCALIADLKRRPFLGLLSFLAVNAVIWGRFVYHLFSPMDLFTAAGLFLLSHLVVTCSYLGTFYFLDPAAEAASDELLASRD